MAAAARSVKPRKRMGRPRICQEDKVLDTHIVIPAKLVHWGKSDPDEGFSAKIRRLLVEEFERIEGHPAYAEPVR